jgi:anion transporter
MERLDMVWSRMIDAWHYVAARLPPSRFIWLGLGPLVLIIFLLNPFGIEPSSASAALGVVLMMGLFWISEVIPLSATALLPVALFPFCGVLPADETAKAYMSDSLMLFLGSFIIGLAMEKHQLHKRIALNMLMHIGNQPRLIVLGMMSTTLLVSMFMSNTSTTAVVAPLGVSIIRQFEQTCAAAAASSSASSIEVFEPAGSSYHPEPVLSSDKLASDTALDVEMAGAHEQPDFPGRAGAEAALTVVAASSNAMAQHSSAAAAHYLVETDHDGIAELDVELPVSTAPSAAINIGKAMMLGTAYAANTGGTATSIGTGPNLVFLALLPAMFHASPGVSFLQWFIFAFPLAIFQASFIFGFLIVRFMRKESLNFDMARLQADHQALGPISKAELVISGDLLLVILLWATRSGFGTWLPGWASLFPYRPGDGTVAVVGAVLLFLWDIIEWREDLLRLPWDIIVLMGGGTAMAFGCAKSGLSTLVAEQFEDLGDFPFVLQIFFIAVLVTVTTELISNIAAANLILPILGALARHLGTNPLLYMVPATIACSYAFMFPISTPPNAIVFSYGFLTIREMALCGFLLNIVGAISLTIWTVTVGPAVFGPIPAAAWVYT